MQKLIPTIYFYAVSLVGLIILIIGIFGSIHFLVGISAYDKYPLGYTPESRCIAPAPVEKGTPTPDAATKAQCFKDVEEERANRKADDLEKALAFTTVGLIVFGIHFYFARKNSS